MTPSSAVTATIRSTAGRNRYGRFAGTLAQPHSESGHWVVDSGVIGAGTDTLSNIEIIQHAGGRYLLVGNGGFATAADAAAAATHAGDTLVFATPPVGPVDIDLGGTDDDLDLTIPGNGDVNITTGDGDNHITVGGGDDHVTTGGGDDTIHTGDGDDVVHAGGGDDAIVGGQGGGNDLYDGGFRTSIRSNTSSATHAHHCRSRWDSIALVTRSSAVRWATSSLLPPLRRTRRSATRRVQDVGVDVLLNVQSATGRLHGDDTIVGNSGNNHPQLAAAPPTSSTGGVGQRHLCRRQYAGDAVYEKPPARAVDTVIATGALTALPANVENLALQGSADLQGYGNADANMLIGNSGNNLLDGGAGADAMYGGARQRLLLCR